MITETKKGYKKTKLGWIPEDWELKRFTDFSELIHGFQFRKEHFVAKGIPVIKIGSLIDSKGIDFADASYIDPSTLNQFEKFKLFKGDVLMALTGGTLGKVSVVQEDFGDILQNYRVGKFVPKKNSYGKYLVQLLQSFFVQQRVKNLVNEAAQPNFGKQDFDKIWIPLPPLPEQQKIATILSTWDKAIDKLTQLIAAKEQRKKGLMQQLLTGKKRFAGFTDEWKEVKLGEIISIGSSKRVLQDDWLSEGVPFIRTREVISLSNGESFRTPIFISEELFSELKRKYGIPKAGDLLATGVGTIGETYIVKQNDRFYFKDGNVLWFKMNSKINSMFLHQQFKTRYIRKQLSDNASITTVSTFTIDGAKGTRVFLPSLEEQQKIASVLSAADKEIELLKNELEQLQQQKKGLMQVLLMGEVRVNTKKI
ncbi:MAG: restriction endonuclease subunit S [Flavobacteriales bacterium]|nr:restriction endonuclease subunit S [Flavobacteriales bacterium]